MTQVQGFARERAVRTGRPSTPRADAQRVHAGLSARVKRLPSDLLYDARGYELLAEVHAEADHYPARAEHDLMTAHVATIAAQVGPHARVVEPWRGNLERTIQLLEALDRPATYVPVGGELAHAAMLRAVLPALDVEPAATFAGVERHDRTLALLPGTAIGSGDATAAVKLLSALGQACTDDGVLLVGVDATSDPDALVRAYDDRAGASARWAKHALATASELCGLGLDVDTFDFAVAWNPMVTRLEMRLVSRLDQTASGITFAAGEPIVIEHRLQYSSESFEALLAIAGWRARRIFTAAPEPMRLWLCERGVPRLRAPRWWQR